MDANNVNCKEKLAKLEQKLMQKELELAALRESEQSYHGLLSSLPNLVLIYQQEKIIYANQAAIDFCGYSKEELIGSRLSDYIPTKYHQTVREKITQRLKGVNVPDYEVEIITKSGNNLTCFIRGNLVTIAGKPAGLVVLTDITRRKKTEDEMIYQKKLFEALFNSTPDAIVFIDQEQKVVAVNDCFCRLFGYSHEEVIGKFLNRLIDPDQKVAQYVAPRIINGTTVQQEATRYGKGGKEIEVMLRGFPLVIDGEVKGGYVIYTDITERKQTEQELKYLSFHDKLTGLYNRAFFEEELKRLNTDRQLPMSLIIGDVNGLKLVNDAFGHGLGDQLLISMAWVLKESCRNEDIICRWGGDEFGIILPGTTREDAVRICKRIKEKCLEVSNSLIFLSISLGTATKVRIDQDIEQTLLEAEDHMYRNKLIEGKSASKSLIAAMHNSLEAKTGETEEHRQRLEKLAVRMGKELGLSHNQLERLKSLVDMHDIGKVALPESITGKLGSLTPFEQEQLKSHCEIGYRIAKAVPELAYIAEEILAHHENWDGSGYPHGLTGKKIPLLSRIIAIVHKYEDLINGRFGADPISKEAAMIKIENSAGKQFDPHLIKLLISLQTKWE